MTGALQLTYTSFDDPASSLGGWQVKAVSPGLSDTALEHALTLVATELDLVEPPSAFPSSAQLAALPRRMLVDVDRQGTAYVVHTSYAGPDASGRHGNVFNHVLVLPALTSSRLDLQPRPVQWWRSPDWRTPYGPEAVRGDPALSAQLNPGTVITRERVGAFLAHQCDSGIASLLDAVDVALGGGPRVVLAIDDSDEAALWMAAASFLAPAGRQDALTFSTFERAHSLQSGGAGPVLCAVPRRDAEEAAALPGHHLLVLPSGPATGSGTWSRLGTALAGTRAVAAERLLALDELAAFNPTATAQRWLWPLALAVAESAQAEAGWADALQVLLDVPAELVDDDETREVVRSIIDAAVVGSSTVVRRALEGVQGVGAVTDHVRGWYVTYLQRLVREPDALAEQWPPFLLPLDPVQDAADLDALAVLIGDALGRVEPGDPLVGLRLLDLTELIGTGPLLGASEPAGAVADLVASALLRDGDLAAAAGPVQRSTALRVAEALDQHLTATSLPSLHPATAAWLLQALDAGVEQLPASVAEELYVAEAALHGPAASNVPALSALLRSDRWEPGAPPAERARAATALLGNPTWTASEAVQLVRATDDEPHVDLDALVRQVLTSTPLGTTQCVELAELVLREELREWAPDVLQLAHVHRTVVHGWWRAGRDRWDDTAQLLVSGSRLYFDRAPDDDLAARLRPLLVAAAVRTSAWDAPPGAAWTEQRLADGLLPVNPQLPELVFDGQASLQPLVAMLEEHDDLAAHVLRVVAALGQSVAVGGQDLLSVPLDRPDEEALGCATLAEAALIAILDRSEQPRAWLARRLTAEVAASDGFLPAWAEDLLADAPPVEDLSATPDKTRGIPWRR